MKPALSLLLCALLPAMAAAAGGGSPYQFLLLDANARAAALGGAYTALAADANALLYNPAGLGGVRRHEATFMHDAHFEGVSQDYLAAATRWGFGAMVNALDYGEIPRTTVSNPNGTLGSYGARDLAVSAGYGREFGRFGAGIAAKHIRSSIDTAVGKAWASDLGLSWRPEEDHGLWLGAAVQNLGPTVRFQAASENLPTTVRAGAAWSFKAYGQRCVVAADFAKTRSDSAVAAAGGETVLGGVLALRLGYSSRNQAGWGLTGGVGLALGDASVDYAVTPFGELGVAHRASVGIRFGGADEEEEDSIPYRPVRKRHFRDEEDEEPPAKPRRPVRVPERPKAKPEPYRDPRRTRY